jgi:hypothetical protein
LDNKEINRNMDDEIVSITTFEENIGYRNNFFRCSISKGEFSWHFQRDEYCQRSFVPFKYVEGIRRKNCEMFQGMKIFTDDK